MAGALVANEAELVDDAQNPLAGLGADDLRAVEDVRDRADGDLGAPGDLLGNREG
jgi:hypothetical protein